MKKSKEMQGFEGLCTVWLESAKYLSQQVLLIGNRGWGLSCFNAFNAEFFGCEQRRPDFNFWVWAISQLLRLTFSPQMKRSGNRCPRNDRQSRGWAINFAFYPITDHWIKCLPMDKIHYKIISLWFHWFILLRKQLAKRPLVWYSLETSYDKILNWMPT